MNIISFGVNTLGKRYTVFVFMSIVLMFFGLTSQAAYAATVTVATGTVTAGGSGVATQVEIHNGNGSVSDNVTSASDGSYTLQLDEDAADGESLTIEVRNAPDGYSTPANSPHVFTYTKGQDPVEVDFAFQEAPKEVNITVTYLDGSAVERFDATAVPLDSAGGNVSENVTGNTTTLEMTGGKWGIQVSRNLSEQDPTRYPYVVLGSMQEVEFADDSSSESIDLDFQVVYAGDTLAKIKPVDKDGDILNQNSFNGDVSFTGYTDEGFVSTKAKVSSETGYAQLYLPPGIYTVDAFHNQQLQNQSFDPASSTFVVESTAGTYDWGTLQAVENQATLSGTVTESSSTAEQSGQAFTGQLIGNLNIKAINTDNGKSFTGQASSDGTFSIINVGPGNYSLTIDDENYIPLKTASASVSATGTVTGLELVVAQSAVTISGTVMDSGGEAIENLPGAVVATVGDSQFTGAIDPETGQYSIKIYDSSASEVTLDLVTQPGAEHYAESQTVENRSITKNIIASSNEGTITGAFVNADGGSALNSSTIGDDAVVTAINIDNGSVEKADVADNGSYSLEVGPGNWKVVGKTDTDVDAIASTVSAETVAVGEGKTAAGTEVPVHTVDGGSVSGTVLDSDSAAVGEARVVVSNVPNLQAASDTPNQEEFITVVGKTAADGTFDVPVPEGEYTVSFGDHPDLSTEFSPTSTTTTVGSAEKALGTFRFAEADATIQGDVGGTLKEGTVTLKSDDGRSVTTELEGGSYSAAVPAGDWTVDVTGIDSNGKIAVNTKEVTVNSGTKSVDFSKTFSTDIAAPAGVQAECEMSETCVVGNVDGAQIRIPAYAAGTSGTMTVQVAPTLEKQEDQIGIAYDINIWDSSGISVAKLDRPAEITLPIDEGLKGSNIDDEELTPAFYQEDLNLMLTDGLVAETDGEKMVIQTDHLTRFAASSSIEPQVESVPKKPRSLKAKKIKAKKARLTWKKPSGSTVDKYKVQTRKCKTKNNTKLTCKKKKQFVKKKNWKKYKNVKKQVNRTRKRRQVKKLKPETFYQFRVRACNDAGCGDWAKWKRFKTKPLATS